LKKKMIDALINKSYFCRLTTYISAILLKTMFFFGKLYDLREKPKSKNSLIYTHNIMHHKFIDVQCP
jgi:hypothetical protein